MPQWMAGLRVHKINNHMIQLKWNNLLINILEELHNNLNSKQIPKGLVLATDSSSNRKAQHSWK